LARLDSQWGLGDREKAFFAFGEKPPHQPPERQPFLFTKDRSITTMIGRSLALI
jgi:hypothetical protein